MTYKVELTAGFDGEGGHYKIVSTRDEAIAWLDKVTETYPRRVPYVFYGSDPVELIFFGNSYVFARITRMTKDADGNNESGRRR